MQRTRHEPESTSRSRPAPRGLPARHLLRALLLFALSGACHDAGVPDEAAQAPMPATRDPGQVAPASQPVPPGPRVRRLPDRGTSTDLETDVSGCRLTLSFEPARLWLRSQPIDPQGGSDCPMLSPSLREGLVALSRERRALVRDPSAKVGLVIDFANDADAVAVWFREQAEDATLQALSQGARDASYNRELGARLLRSQALEPQRALLRDMGFGVTRISLEKVEVTRASKWKKMRPDLELEGLAPKALLALPNLTWLELVPAR